jgi:hypothetical protein
MFRKAGIYILCLLRQLFHLSPLARSGRLSKNTFKKYVHFISVRFSPMTRNVAKLSLWRLRESISIILKIV